MHSGARQVRKCHAKALSVLDLVVSPWPWPLTCWPQNLISSSLSRNALKLKCGETSTNSFKKYCEQTLSICHKKHSSTLPLLNSRDVNPTGTIHASFDSRWSVIPSGCRTGLEHSTATRSECPSSAENWRPFCSSRHSLMRSDNVLCFICVPIAQCWSVTMYWLLQTDFINTVRWSYSSIAIMPPMPFISTTTTTTNSLKTECLQWLTAGGGTKICDTKIIFNSDPIITVGGRVMGMASGSVELSVTVLQHKCRYVRTVQYWCLSV